MFAHGGDTSKMRISDLRSESWSPRRRGRSPPACPSARTPARPPAPPTRRRTRAGPRARSRRAWCWPPGQRAPGASHRVCGLTSGADIWHWSRGTGGAWRLSSWWWCQWVSMCGSSYTVCHWRGCGHYWGAETWETGPRLSTLGPVIARVTIKWSGDTEYTHSVLTLTTRRGPGSPDMLMVRQIAAYGDEGRLLIAPLWFQCRGCITSL